MELKDLKEGEFFKVKSISKEGKVLRPGLMGVLVEYEEDYERPDGVKVRIKTKNIIGGSTVVERISKLTSESLPKRKRGRPRKNEFA